MPEIVIYTQNPLLTYVKLSQGAERWAGNGTDGAAGTGNMLRLESQVAAGNHANGLLPATAVNDKDGNFAGRYLVTIPSDLDESELPYGLQGFIGPAITDASDERGEFAWDGENIVTLQTVQVTAASVSLIVAPIHTTASGGAVVSGKITLYQYSPIDVTITIVDELREAVDMTGKELELVVFDYDDEETEIFTVSNSGFTIGGTDSNQLRVRAAASGRTGDAGRFRWLVRELNDDELLDLRVYARGECLIVKMPSP